MSAADTESTRQPESYGGILLLFAAAAVIIHVGSSVGKRVFVRDYWMM